MRKPEVKLHLRGNRVATGRLYGRFSGVKFYAKNH